MMIYSVREPYTFEIYLKMLEILTLSVAIIVDIDCFEQVSDVKVIFPVLLKYYVSAGNCCF